MRTACLNLSFMSLRKPQNYGLAWSQFTKQANQFIYKWKVIGTFLVWLFSCEGRGRSCAESTYSHNPSAFFHWLFSRLQCPWPIPCQPPTFEGNHWSHTPPSKNSPERQWSHRQVALSTCVGALLAFVTPLSLKPLAEFSSSHCQLLLAFATYIWLSPAVSPLLHWLWPRSSQQCSWPQFSGAWASPRPGRLCDDVGSNN